MKLLRLVVLASGRGSNFAAIQDAIVRGELKAEIIAVVSNKEIAKALERAVDYGIKGLFVNPFSDGKKLSPAEYDQKLADLCHELNPDYICLAGYMRILTNEFIDRFNEKILNIHPSLLPAFPGLDAQKQAYDYGVKYSGCTVHFVDEGMDTGPIIAQAVVPVEQGDTCDDLTKRILKEEHRLYPLVLQWLAEDRVELTGRKVVIKK